MFRRIRQRHAYPGVKLVRGAYLEKENLRAREMRYPTPIQPSKAATDADFNAAMIYILERIDSIGVCLGTHNEESCKMAANYMVANGIDRKHPNVYFSQLFGMSDNISFNLAEAGFNVGKYLPYGPLESVMPYLFRRAQENSSVAGQTGRELSLIETELKRREKASTFRKFNNQDDIHHLPERLKG
jgi:proline dehydrogenase